MVKGVFDEKSPSKGNSFEGNFIWLKMNYLVLIFAVLATFKKSIKSRKTAFSSGFSWWKRVDSLLADRRSTGPSSCFYPAADCTAKTEARFESTYKEKHQTSGCLFGVFGGRGWIRTTEVVDVRFTV